MSVTCPEHSERLPLPAAERPSLPQAPRPARALFPPVRALLPRVRVFPLPYRRPAPEYRGSSAQGRRRSWRQEYDASWFCSSLFLSLGRVSLYRAVLPVFTLYYAGTAHALQDILVCVPEQVKNRLFFFETADFRAYSISAGGSRRVMLRRLTVSVYALCSSAEVAGGRMPATPRQISIKLKPMMFR